MWPNGPHRPQQNVDNFNSSTSLTSLTGYSHLPLGQSQQGRCRVIARVKSGLHHRGCMVNTCSCFHTWCLPQRKTQTSKPDILLPPLKGRGPVSNVCRSKQLVVSQEKAGASFNRCRRNVQRKADIFHPSAPENSGVPLCAIINNVCVIPDTRGRKDQREEFIRGVSEGWDIQFVSSGSLYPYHSSCLVHQQVSGSHLAPRPNNTAELQPKTWHCLGLLTGTGFGWL